MIRSTNSGFVTFETDDGEVRIMSIEQYNVFAEKNGFKTLANDKAGT